jgi:hypothetical protein
MKRWTYLILIVLMALMTACGPNSPSSGPQSWFDAPLDNSILPMSAVQVTSHAADPGGLSQMELSVNGAVVDTSPSSNTSDNLVTFNQTWTPPRPGNYTLQIRAQNSNGDWGGYASEQVTVSGGGVVQGLVYADLNEDGDIQSGEGPLDGVTVALSGCGPALSQVTSNDGKFAFVDLPAGSCQVQVTKAGWNFSGSFPRLSYPIPVASDPSLPTAFSIYMAPVAGILATITQPPAPTPTLTTTAIPSATPTPVAAAASISVQSVSTNTVYYRGNCSPKDVTIQVNASDSIGITAVVLFYRAQGANGNTTDFLSKSMSPVGGDLYQATVNPESDFGGGTLANMGGGTLQYQAVIQDQNGDTSVRTDLQAGVNIATCGGGASAPSPTAPPTLIVIPPITLNTLTPTPVIIR